MKNVRFGDRFEVVHHGEMMDVGIFALSTTTVTLIDLKDLNRYDPDVIVQCDDILRIKEHEFIALFGDEPPTNLDFLLDKFYGKFYSMSMEVKKEKFKQCKHFVTESSSFAATYIVLKFEDGSLTTVRNPSQEKAWEEVFKNAKEFNFNF